ncbi:MAG: rod shape-determining protein MreC [Peptococcaceae bacterium]|nr:MAG: rod shape-determining protein MreC [Peptococcaceae bacterium]
MNHRVSVRRLFFLSILVVFVLVSIRFTSPEKAIPMKESLKDVFLPVQISLASLGRRVYDWVSAPVLFYKTAGHYRELEQKIAELEGQITQLTETKLENERLSRLLDYSQTAAGQYEFITASVVGRDLGSWFGTVTLNKGTNSGIKKDMVVLTPDGLAGRVMSVSFYTSEVLLITDPRSGVSTLIQESRTPGIVEGITGDSGLVRMIHLPSDALVDVGQTIVTAGLGSIFPKGIPVGRVVAIRRESPGLFKSADIRPFADLNRLEEVLVIKQVLP